MELVFFFSICRSNLFLSLFMDRVRLLKNKKIKKQSLGLQEIFMEHTHVDHGGCQFSLSIFYETESLHSPGR